MLPREMRVSLDTSVPMNHLFWPFPKYYLCDLTIIKNTNQLNFFTGGLLNKQLPASNLSPSQPGDFYYTFFSIFASRQNFLDADVKVFNNTSTFYVNSSDKSFGCSECLNELGLYEMDGNLLQFWHHSVQMDMVSKGFFMAQTFFYICLVKQEDTIDFDTKQRGPEDTLGSIISGIVSEMMGRQAQICLELRGAKLHLLLTVLEPNLNFFAAENGMIMMT